ncbi:hypothetical protein [Herminiimonas sp. CN]|uniref:hypothetical protein n=1 Tax=Herminiimonas sp. CN TaxID=1349818 RepID=UPI0004741FF5|nr:hypothetical protein [Herminiimonas sp. CN]
MIDRHTAIVPQMVLADFIAEGHFNRHIRRTRDAYAQRCGFFALPAHSGCRCRYNARHGYFAF